MNVVREKVGHSCQTPLAFENHTIVSGTFRPTCVDAEPNLPAQIWSKDVETIKKLSYEMASTSRRYGLNGGL